MWVIWVANGGNRLFLEFIPARLWAMPVGPRALLERLGRAWAVSQDCCHGPAVPHAGYSDVPSRRSRCRAPDWETRVVGEEDWGGWR